LAKLFTFSGGFVIISSTKIGIAVGIIIVIIGVVAVISSSDTNSEETMIIHHHTELYH